MKKFFFFLLHNMPFDRRQLEIFRICFSVYWLPSIENELPDLLLTYLSQRFTNNPNLFLDLPSWHRN